MSPFAAPVDSATAAALRYTSDALPGITRRRSGAGFRYVAPEGTAVRDRATLARIKALVIPPAWTAVWISPDPSGHVQATGRDVRGRKQYRYHPRWHAVRDATKYERLREFGRALPGIRARVAADLKGTVLSKEKVLAIVVQLLELTRIRVGNDEYARSNQSFGLTTLLNRHVDISGNAVHFHFRGKSGKAHSIDVADRRIARLVQRCRELPGQHLFQYLDDEGAPRAITSTDVNDYLREISGQDFSAKDFRTWAGTLLAAEQLLADEVAGADALPKRVLVDVVKSVAAQLGNTPAVCRRCYIHPHVLAAFADDAARARWLKQCASGETLTGLSSSETALLRFLEPIVAAVAA